MKAEQTSLNKMALCHGPARLFQPHQGFPHNLLSVFFPFSFLLQSKGPTRVSSTVSAVEFQIALAEKSPFICFLITVESPAFKSFEFICSVPNKLLLLPQTLLSFDCITLAHI